MKVKESGIFPSDSSSWKQRHNRILQESMNLTDEEFAIWRKNYELTQAGELGSFGSLEDLRALCMINNKIEVSGDFVMIDVEGNRQLMEFILDHGIHEGFFVYEYDRSDGVAVVHAFVLSEAVKKRMEKVLSEWQGSTRSRWFVEVNPERCPVVVRGKSLYDNGSEKKSREKWLESFSLNHFDHPEVQRVKELVQFFVVLGQTPERAVRNAFIMSGKEEPDCSEIVVIEKD